MSAALVERGVWSLLDGVTQREFRVERDGEDFVLTLRGRSMRIRIEDPRGWTATSSGKSNTGLAKVSTPMPGKVVRVLVHVGDLVQASQGLVVVEAMKMQNELKSPIAGIVKQVQALEGATVSANQVLVVVESSAS